MNGPSPRSPRPGPGGTERPGNGGGESRGFEPPRETETLRGTEGAREGRSATGLLRQLVDETAVLFRKELALAAAEVGQSVDTAKKGAASMVSGGAVLFAGLLFLLAAAAAGLAEVLPNWAAILIVGAVVALIGFIMVKAGKKKLEPGSFRPERTVASVRKDTDALKRHTP